MTDATRGRSLVITLSDDDREQLKRWTPCTRIRLDPVDDETCRLVIDQRATCTACKGVGMWTSEDLRARCKYCGGTGLR